MHIKALLNEDFVNYKLPHMTITTCYCTFKCDAESGTSCCQNSRLAEAIPFEISDDKLIARYLENDITKAIVFAGLEPFEQFGELRTFIDKLRNEYHCSDAVVIYTGFNKTEILFMINELKKYKNIIVKFGRFVPNREKKYDDVLGVYLASPNQYAEVIC